MCGISVLIRVAKGCITTEMISAMTDIVKHRGPDDEGFVLIANDFRTVIPYGGKSTPENIYETSLPYTPKKNRAIENFAPTNISILLGHRRLSIVDISAAGHQPMCLSDDMWITYNGEIYNFPEIRRELEVAGYNFYSHTDTEVILAAYKQWGRACLNKFNGMFAFVLIDLEKQCFFAARDRFGVKPLYFWKSPQGFLAFASEIKQFTVLPGWCPKVNISRSIDYLAHGLTDFSGETLFSGVFQLKGGEYIESPLAIDDIPAIKRWYQLNKVPCRLTFAEASDQFYNLFSDAVKLRLRADVNVGSCLSGGLDSSSIVCMANHLLRGQGYQKNQKTFSARSHIPQFDEHHYMEEVIRSTDIEAHFVTPSLDSLLRSIKSIVWQQDEPFGSSSIYAQYLVFNSAREAGVKVMLDGQGADESLLGYSQFWEAHFAQLVKERRWSAYCRERKLAVHINPSLKISPLGLLKNLLSVSSKRSLKNMLLKNPLNRIFFPWINFKDFPYVNSAAYDGRDFHHQVEQLSFDQLNNTNLPALLRYEDRNSMAHSIEARTPFLDYRLVEFVFSLPAEYKISGYTKRILRESLHMLPEKVRLRTDKLGFATAEEYWMCHDQPDLFRREISEAVIKSRGFINSEAINLADKMLSRQIPFDWRLWRIINFGYWMEAYM